MANKESGRARREAARRARQRQRRLRWAAAAAVVVLAVIGAALLSIGSEEQAGVLAPDFVLETPNGDTVRLSDYRGKPLALTFMHTD